MANRTYGPSWRSLAIDIIRSLGLACLPVSLWLVIPHVPHGIRRAILLAAAVLFTAFELLFIHLPLLVVATTRITVGPLAVSSGQGLHRRLLWRDVNEVLILEQYRPNQPPLRTDRMVLIKARPQMITCNPSAWPRAAEDEFLSVLEQKSLEYGFLISRQTTST